MSFNFELYLENDNSQSLYSYIYQLARVLKWSVLVSVTSLISIAVLLSVKPVAGKKTVKNKLVLSSASDLQTSNTIYSVGAKAWNSKNERIFKRNNFFLSFVLVSCFLFLNFARREFYVFPITGNTKVTGCWIFRLCAVLLCAKHLAALGGLQFSESCCPRDVKNDLLWSCNGEPCRNSKGMVVFSRLIRRRS